MHTLLVDVLIQLLNHMIIPCYIHSTNYKLQTVYVSFATQTRSLNYPLFQSFYGLGLNCEKSDFYSHC